MYYNSLMRSGSTIEDPPFLFNLEIEGRNPSPELPLGDLDARYTAQEVIGYLAMRAYGVTLGQLPEWAEKYKPVLVFTHVVQGTEYLFDFEGNKLKSRPITEKAEEELRQRGEGLKEIHPNQEQ